MAYTTIDDPTAYFQVKTYTGTGSSQAFTLDSDTDLQPDVVWIKNRGVADSWCHQNDVLGVGKTHAIDDDAAVADETDCIDSFDSDGFTVDSDDKVNASSETYVAYCWKESATSGFDIYTYSGTGSQVTVSHSLGATPDAILNFLNTGSAWDSTVYLDTTNMGTGKGIFMTLTNAAQSTTYVDSTTSSNFLTTNMSTSGRTYFGYALKSKQGFSKFGSYTGNGNADGPMIFLGFRPAFIMIKRTDSTGDWGIFDNKREGYNDETNRLKPNGNDAEEDDNFMDILSNGFKLRLTSSSINASGGTFIYAAFAEAPLVNSNGVPCNAR